MKQTDLQRVKVIASRYLDGADLMCDSDVTFVFVDDLRDMIWSDLKVVCDSYCRKLLYNLWTELGNISSRLFPVLEINPQIDFPKLEDAKLAKECVNPLIHFE